MGKKGKSRHIAYRKLEVVYLREVDIKTTGVYILWFGERFYIGKANNIKSRISSHKSIINYVLGAALHGWKPKQLYGSYEPIVQHLIENPEINVIEVDILDVCQTEQEALQEEDLWHKVLISHPLNHFCLNKLNYLPDLLFFIGD